MSGILPLLRVVLSSPLLFSFLPTPVGVFFGKIKRMETGKLLRELRHYLKISVRDFSAKLGVVPTPFHHFRVHCIRESGVSIQIPVKDICQAFNVDKEYFKGTMTLEDAVDYSGYNHQRVERIRDMMNERGIKTNKELSLLSGISTTRLSDIMAEKNKLTEDKARKIADALEVGVDWILYGDQEKKYFPVNGKMIEWLKDHPEIREQIWKMMEDC